MRPRLAPSSEDVSRAPPVNAMHQQRQGTATIQHDSRPHQLRCQQRLPPSLFDFAMKRAWSSLKMLQGQARLHSPVHKCQAPAALFVFLNSALRLHAAHRAYVANVHETASDEHVFLGFHWLITARTSNDRGFAHLALHAPPHLSRSLPEQVKEEVRAVHSWWTGSASCHTRRNLDPVQAWPDECG
jgi:hypothetical protein